MAVNLIFAGWAAAATPEAPRVFEAAPGPKSPPARLAHLPAKSIKAIRFNRAASARLKAGDEMIVDLPRVGQRRFVHDRMVNHPNGDVTIVGRLKGHGPQYRIIVSTGEGGSTGRMMTPDGLFRIEQGANGVWVVDVDRAGLKLAPMGDDARVPPTKGKTLDAGSSGAAGRPSAESPVLALGVENGSAPPPFAPAKAEVLPNSNQIVDLMVLYTPGMVSTYGAGLTTRLDYLVELANQAYIDSGVRITLRLVRSKLVGYGDSLPDNNTALDQLTDSHALLNLFTDIERTHLGADMVALIRPYDDLNHGSCGVAWINNNSFFLGNPESNYAIVSDGDNDGFYCSDYALAHELGHNMGSAHDRANASFPGISPYSYGYGVAGTFGTIMSYFDPQVGLFSSPATICSNIPFYACGVAVGDPNEANNALSLNNVAPVVANSVNTAARKDNDAVFDFGASGLWIRTQNGTFTRIHTANAANVLASADIDGNGQNDIVIDFGTGVGTYVWMNNSAYVFLHPGSPEGVYAANLNANAQTDLVMDFGTSGLWTYVDNSTYTFVHSANPSHIAVGNINASSVDDFVVGFTAGGGIWAYLDNNLAAPVFIHPGALNNIARGDIDGDGFNNVILDFASGGGIWNFDYNSRSFTFIHPGTTNHIVRADLDENGVADLVMDFAGSGGIWRYMNNAGFSFIHPSTAVNIEANEWNNAGSTDVLIDFGAGGLWVLQDNASFVFIRPGGIDSLTATEVNKL